MTTSNSKFEFKEVQGDLFVDPLLNDSLAHCVSADLEMGKGIAATFKEKFQGIPELKSQGKKVGEVAYLKQDGRYIFYIITKERYYHKPTRENFEIALTDLRRLCEKLGVKRLSIPRIGAGLDKLPLEFVHEVIAKVFEGCDLKMTMYYL